MVRKVRTKKYGKRKHRRSLKRKSKKSRHFRKRHMHKSKKRRQKGGDDEAIPLYVLYIYLDSEDAGPGNLRRGGFPVPWGRRYIKNGMNMCRTNYNVCEQNKNKIDTAKSKIDIAKCKADYEICKYDSTIEKNQTEEDAAPKKDGKDDNMDELMRLMNMAARRRLRPPLVRFGETANAAVALCQYWQEHREDPDRGEFINLPMPGEYLFEFVELLRRARQNEKLMKGMVAKMLRNYENNIRGRNNQFGETVEVVSHQPDLYAEGAHARSSI